MVGRLDGGGAGLVVVGRLGDDEADLMRMVIVYLSTLNSADKEIFSILPYIVSSNRLDKTRRTPTRELG
jgi:hypothetical protein